MLNKKIILPFAAFAMASFVACGDDGSSSAPAANNSNAPASVQTLEEAINLACSSTENMCVKVYVEEDKDTVQCNGTIFTPMSMGKPVEGCGNTAPAAETPANPDAETPAAEEPAGENPGAGKEPADPGAGDETVDLGGGEEPAGPGAGEEPAGPGAGEEPAGPGAGEEPAGPGAGEEPAGPGAGEEPAGPGAGEEPAGPGAGEEPAGPGAGEQPAAGDKVYCLKQADFACVEGPASLASGCSESEGETLVDQCPAGGEVCDIGENGIIMNLYEGYGMTCAELKAFMSMSF